MMFIFKKEMEVIKKCVSLIEGEIDTINFIQEFISNQNFEKYMKKAAKHNKTSFLTVEFVKENINLYTSFYNKYTIQSIVIRYLNQKRIPYNLRVREYILVIKYKKYIPHYIPCIDSTFELIDKIEKKENHSRKYYEDLFSNIYKYDKYPPHWLSSIDWPIDDDGTPSKFLYQTGLPNDKDYIRYYFQKKDGSTIVIEQYD